MPTETCESCLNQNPSYARFCNLCGAPLADPHAVGLQPSVSSRFSGAVPYLIGLGLAVLFASLLGIVGGFTSFRTSAPVNTSAATPQSSTSTLPPITAEDASFEGVSITGRVTGVSDGDTITILDDGNVQHKVRLAGIDAPEAGQDFGNKAKKYLADLVFGKVVTVQGDKIDKYGRRVGKVLIDGKDINLELVTSGFAWHYKKYAPEQSEGDQIAYADAETAARSLKSNVWSMPDPVAPWDYRAGGAIDPQLKDKILGNKTSMLYHWSDCPGFAKIAKKNRIVFDTWEQAENAGYAVATNCPSDKPVSEFPEAMERDDQFVSSDGVPVIPKVIYQAPPTPAIYETPRAASSPKTAPKATASCYDGTYSYELDPREQCVTQGGVYRTLYGEAPSPTQSATPVPNPVYTAPPNYSAPGASLPSSSSRTDRPPDGAPKTVQVRGYFRKDGTYVAPHTRRAPRRN